MSFLPKTPSFWYRPAYSPAPLSETLLAPFSKLYTLGHKLNTSCKKTQKASVPVICIGNLTAGGSGKTPTAIAVLELIKKHNIAKNPFFLTRGYGGNITEPTQVDLEKHTYIQTGDEPLLLARHAPVIVAADRYAGAMYAQNQGADMIIMDDGFQNPSLHKDVSILVVDGQMGFGNLKTLPAGPLRERLENGLQKADCILMIGDDTRDTIYIVKNIAPALPVLNAHIEALEIPDKSKNYYAFAGLGYPEKFFSTLKKAGLPLVKTHSFADHHPYTEQEIETLLKEAQSLKSTLITTEKDYIRLPTSYRNKIKTLPILLKINDIEVITSLLKQQK